MRQKIEFNGSTLKWFAIVTMLIDHIGAVVILRGFYRAHGGVIPVRLLTEENQQMLHDLYYVLRGIGRLSFPIFCFFIVEGFLKTRNVGRYAGRLLLFGLVSEIPFNLAIGGSLLYPDHQNVMFTMLIGLLTLVGIRYFWNGDLDTIDWRAILGTIGSVAAGCGIAYLLKTDYNYKGIALIVVLYLFRERRDVQCLTGAAAIAWENWAPLSFILAYFYNGQRGKQSKYVFYVFYPAHLLFLAAIADWGVPRFLGIL